MKRYIFTYLFSLAFLFAGKQLYAQTTISTTAPSSFTFLSGSCGVTFVLDNTNSYAVTLTEVKMWRNTASTSATYTLWYSATSLSGSGTVQPSAWSQIAQVSPSNVSTSAVYSIFNGLSFTIPANTKYRFCVQSSNRVDYSTSNTSNIFSSGGINLLIGNYQISGSNVGYAGSGTNVSLANNPRFFHGSVTFAPACNAPTGLASSNITATSASLTWNAVSGSQGYEYALTQSATPPASGTAIATTSYNAGPLSATTTYYMHVRNKCSSTSFSSWVTTSFTTLTSCFPVTTANTSNLTASSGTLHWSTGPGSAGYEWVIDQNAGNPSGNGTPTLSTSASFSGLTSGATYYAHVRNVCSPTDKSQWLHYQFTMPECNKPSNLLISNITDTSADMLWSKMTNAGAYEYAVDFNNQPPVSGIHTSAITAHVGDLLPNSKYYVHLRSSCFVADNSSWRLDSFVTKITCYPPQVQVNNLGTSQPYAFWNAVPASIGYEYALRKDSFNAPAFGTTTYNTNASLTLPEDGSDYFLYVRTKCNSMFTFSNWAVTALRTGSTGISGIQGRHISVYPNPVQNKMYIDGAGKGNYTITDVTGRVLLQGSISSGATEVNTAALTPGLYLLRLSGTQADELMRFRKE